jgi:hypothetical protein
MMPDMMARLRRALPLLLLACNSSTGTAVDAAARDTGSGVDALGPDAAADGRADTSPVADAADHPATDARADAPTDVATTDAASADAAPTDAAPTDATPADGAPRDATFVPGRCVAGGSCLANDFCNYCDAQGTNFSCRCVQGAWSCTSTPAPCGVACGSGRCLGTEVCVGTSVAGGVPGSPPPVPTYECHPRPAACTGQPTCACAATLCGPPAACPCRDSAPSTIRCECAAP